MLTFDNCISSVLIQNAYRNIKYRQQIKRKTLNYSQTKLLIQLFVISKF